MIEELDENVTPVSEVVYDTTLVTDHLVWEMLGELVSFPDMVWFDKIEHEWREFLPGSTFVLFPDGHVENN